MLPLVVGDTAAVPAAIAFGQGPRRQPRLPGLVEPAYDIAVAIAQHRDGLCVLDPLGIEEGCARLRRLVQEVAGEAHVLERWTHLLFEVAQELDGSVRVLAFGRDCNAAGEIGLEGTRVEMVESSGNGDFAGHTYDLRRSGDYGAASLLLKHPLTLLCDDKDTGSSDAAQTDSAPEPALGGRRSSATPPSHGVLSVCL